MTKPPESDLIGVTAAAKVLRVSRGRVHQMLQEGKLTATLIGISYVLRRADVLAMRDGRQAPKAKKTA